MFLDKLAGLEFIVQVGNPFVEGLLVICALLDTVIQVDIDSALPFQGIPLVWPLLGVVPFRSDSMAIRSGSSS